VERMGETRDVYRLSVGKPEGKRPVGRLKCRWIDNIRMDLLDVVLSDKMLGIYRVAAQLVASRVVISSTELVS
jgi:hypothetical protein